MNKNHDPVIVHVDQVNNAAVVIFQGEEKPTVYPAFLLYAAKDIADILHEKDSQQIDGLSALVEE